MYFCSDTIKSVKEYHTSAFDIHHNIKQNAKTISEINGFCLEGQNLKMLVMRCGVLCCYLVILSLFTSCYMEVDAVLKPMVSSKVNKAIQFNCTGGTIHP